MRSALPGCTSLERRLVPADMAACVRKLNRRLSTLAAMKRQVLGSPSDRIKQRPVRSRTLNLL